MTDYSELKRLAEACENHNWRFLTEKLTEYGIRDDHGYIAFLPVEHPAKYGACPAREAKARFLGAMTPAAVLALIAENERLERLAESRLLNWEAEGRALLEACSDRNQLKAENEALRKQIPSTEIVWCACGDGHAANSYGAGFMDANGGVCANCDAANQGVEPDLDAMRKDAERYRWLRSQHWNESGMVVACHPKKSVKLGFDCPSGERLDHAIDAAMSKGEQV